MSPEADVLLEKAIAAFVAATVVFDFETAERAFTVALVANSYIKPAGDLHAS